VGVKSIIELRQVTNLLQPRPAGLFRGLSAEIEVEKSGHEVTEEELSQL